MKLMRTQPSRIVVNAQTASGQSTAVPINEVGTEQIQILINSSGLAAGVVIRLHIEGTVYRVKTYDPAVDGVEFMFSVFPHGATAISINKLDAAGSVTVRIIEVESVVTSVPR